MTDPDATLRELREMASDSDPDNAARSRRYGELIRALDDWLSYGGILPKAWKRKKSKRAKDPGPWHIVSRRTGVHIGPFTTELDCIMAKQVATRDWLDGIVMDRKTFDKHLKERT